MLFERARGEAARISTCRRPPSRCRPPRSKVDRIPAWSSGRRHEGIDASVFQELPLYVRERVLSDGGALLVNDADALCEIRVRDPAASGDFRPQARRVLEGAANG